LRGGELKGILRSLARKHFSSTITDRPKHGFGVPVGDFFRSDFGGMRTLLHDALSGSEPFGRVHGVVDLEMAGVRSMIEEHHTGVREHSARLFTLLSMALWARTLP
jgi:asparagine synthase (glutamine-hydrolysing)